MKKLIALLMTVILCFAAIPALSETVDSSEYDPEITMTLPDPEWKIAIHCAQANKSLEVGSEVTLTAEVTTKHSEYYKVSDYSVSYNWQAKAPGGDWKSVGSGDTYSFKLNADNVNWIFKVTVTLSK